MAFSFGRSLAAECRRQPNLVLADIRHNDAGPEKTANRPLFSADPSRDTLPKSVQASDVIETGLAQT
jgi:hypothetical protein